MFPALPFWRFAKAQLHDCLPPPGWFPGDQTGWFITSTNYRRSIVQYITSIEIWNIIDVQYLP